MRALLLAVVVLSLGPLAAAYGQSSPIGPLPAPAPAPAPVQTTASGGDTTDSGGLKTWQEVLIFGAGVLLIAGIGWGIVHDARSVAPVREGEVLGGDAATRPRRSERAKRQARARAKAARAQRRRNR